MRICIFRKVAWYTRAVDLAQFYRKDARGTQKNKGTAIIFAWFCTRSRGHGQQRDPAKTSGRRPLRKRCRFTIDPQVQYLLVEGTALGIYSSQALKGSDAALPMGCSAPFVPCVTNETDYPLARWHKKRQKQTKRQHVASETVNPLATGEMYYIRI